jgi:hypothetical protein
VDKVRRNTRTGQGSKGSFQRRDRENKKISGKKRRQAGKREDKWENKKTSVKNRRQVGKREDKWEKEKKVGKREDKWENKKTSGKKRQVNNLTRKRVR